jgi:hypothetical protein
MWGRVGQIGGNEHLGGCKTASNSQVSGNGQGSGLTLTVHITDAYACTRALRRSEMSFIWVRGGLFVSERGSRQKFYYPLSRECNDYRRCFPVPLSIKTIMAISPITQVSRLLRSLPRLSSPRFHFLLAEHILRFSCECLAVPCRLD